MFEVTSKTHEMIQASLEAMPGLASGLIRSRQDMSLAANQRFAENPDDPAAHEFHWHQFGIITHCKRFQEFLEAVVPDYLKKWGVAEAAYRTFKQEIDGLSKWQLLQLAAFWHDVGKFTARKAYTNPQGQSGFNFKGHEKHSGEIIRGELRPFFKKLQLTDAQIEYIANCGELHFELGKLRREAKSRYTLAFAESAQGRAKIKHILQTYKPYALEIGLCFLADSLSKVEVYTVAKDDREIEAQKSQLSAKLAAKNLPDLLINAALNMPVNVKITEVYLQEWFAKKRHNGILWLRLDGPSAAALKVAFPPKFKNEFYHHITLAFDTSKEDVKHFIGKKAKVKAYAYACNDQVEAVRVTTDGLPDTYGVPHTTLSTDEGIKPFQAVAMLHGRHSEERLDEPIMLQGTLEFVPF